jgi:hypothetical protein
LHFKRLARLLLCGLGMRAFLFAFASTALLACAASPADDQGGPGGGGGGKADDGESSCPVDGDADKILEAIEGGGNCYTAAGIAESCAYGSSLDVQFVAAATEVCSAGFGAMDAGTRQTYDYLVQRCWEKYENQEGTLYRAMAAHCTLEVTRLAATLFPASSTPEPRVAYTEECPVDGSNAEAISAAIERSTYCGQAADIAESCAFGSSIDVQFTASASEKCTVEMNDADELLRDSLYRGCAQRFADEGGTLGRSMVAFCSLQVNVMFEALYSDVE